ncbi:MAG TPA: ankyrin repeat domain-containing protein, partial [Thiolinea sp.]|nr:ankyrin repeat domain-containing protein [Thiolinea sp.]
MKITRTPIAAACVLAVASLPSVHTEAFPYPDEAGFGPVDVEYARNSTADYALTYDGMGAGSTVYDNADIMEYTPVDDGTVYDQGGDAQDTGQAYPSAGYGSSRADPVETMPDQTQGGAVYYDVVGAWQGGQSGMVQTDALPAPQPAPATYSAAELGDRLLTAVRAGDTGDIRWLLRRGADPEYKPHAGALSALDLVVQGSWVAVADIFYEEGVNFNRQGDQGITFLHQAAAAGKLPMVRFLVKAGLSPNARTVKDWTPLHHAARFGHAGVVAFLLRAGSDPEQRNSDGLRA